MEYLKKLEKPRLERDRRIHSSHNIDLESVKLNFEGGDMSVNQDIIGVVTPKIEKIDEVRDSQVNLESANNTKSE